MKISRKAFRAALTTLIVGGFVEGAQVANANITTTLTGVEGVGSNSDIPDGHGDTAESQLTWRPNGGGGWQTYTGWPNAGENGDAYQVDGSEVFIDFAPIDVNTQISVDDFDLNVWPGGGDTDVEWQILDGPDGSVLAGDTLTVANGTVQNILANYAGDFGQTLTLRLIQNTGAASYFAMDNLTFTSTVVPEPASLGVLGTGMGALALRRRRRR